MEGQIFVTRLPMFIKRHILARILLVLAVCSLWGSATRGMQAQGLASVLTGKKTAPAQPNTGADPLGRDTPRSAMYGFLEACHRSDFTKAARYLDLSRLSSSEQGKAGPELARALGLLLDRDPHFELGQLDSTPGGRPDDELAPDVDRLDSFAVGTRSVPLYVQRVKRDDGQIWLVSPDSVQRIPQLAVFTKESPIEKLLPAPLLNTQLLGTPVWVWMALVVVAMLVAALSRLLSRAAITIAKPIARRYVTAASGLRLQALTGPLRLLLAVAVFRGCMEAIAPSALLRDFLLKLLALLFVFGAAALLMRVVDLISENWISRLDPRERAMSYSVLPLGVRFVKICVFCLAALTVLRQWGVDISAVLAGVGVGGLAVALAAQRTIENLFGGISVISDRPVLVGDVCQFGGQMGTVEDIGLRSTRIRTNDRTLVTVPNSQFSTMTLENFSRRDRFWFHPTLALRRDTPPEKIREAIEVIGRFLTEHPDVDATGLPVRFTKIAPEAFQLEVFAYVLTTDGTQFMRMQSELLLSILNTMQSIGVRLAVPFQENGFSE